MSVVSLSQLNLVRARREMEKAHRCQNWDAVKDWDGLLTEQLDKAFDDPNRDQRMLLDELENILSLYARMVDNLPEDTANHWLKGKPVTLV